MVVFFHLIAEEAESRREEGLYIVTPEYMQQWKSVRIGLVYTVH